LPPVGPRQIALALALGVGSLQLGDQVVAAPVVRSFSIKVDAGTKEVQGDAVFDQSEDDPLQPAPHPFAGEPIDVFDHQDTASRNVTGFDPFQEPTEGAFGAVVPVETGQGTVGERFVEGEPDAVGVSLGVVQLAPFAVAERLLVGTEAEIRIQTGSGGST